VSQAKPVRVPVVMAADAVARIVAGEIPDHLVNPEIATSKGAAS
jgi:hypothetical protein